MDSIPSVRRARGFERAIARARARARRMSPRARRDVHHRGFDRHRHFFSPPVLFLEIHARPSSLSFFSPRVSPARPRLALAAPTPSHRDADGNDGDDDDGDDGDDDATLETEDATRRERSRVGRCVSNAAMDRTTARATDRALERATRGVMNTAWNEWER
tara:strand:+ start:671 stop:1150 length:480 start_codon:yes stop_codon:yes gene_type:complete